MHHFNVHRFWRFSSFQLERSSGLKWQMFCTEGDRVNTVYHFRCFSQNEQDWKPMNSSCFTCQHVYLLPSPPVETIPPFPTHWSMHSEWRRTCVSSTSKLWSDMDLQKWAVDTLWVRTHSISKQTHTPSLARQPLPSPLLYSAIDRDCTIIATQR